VVEVNVANKMLRVMKTFQTYTTAAKNLKQARTSAWRKANEGESQSLGDTNTIPREFSPEVSKAWDAFDLAKSALDEKKDQLPDFDFMSENDVVFVTLR